MFAQSQHLPWILARMGVVSVLEKRRWWGWVKGLTLAAQESLS